MADDKAAKKEARQKKRAEDKAKRAEETKGMKIAWQYVLGVIVTLGGFVCGTGIGWSSPAKHPLNENGITDEQFSWIASIFALGAALAQVLTAVAIRYIGLKYTIVLLYCIVGAAWIPIVACPNNFIAVLLGRLFTGLSGGFCVACPTYVGEMANKYHRGTLGVFFQLFITGGILYTFVIGITADVRIISIACAAWCVVAIILTIIFVPETPFHYLRRDKPEKAAKVMEKLRGKTYNSEKELDEMKASLSNNDTLMTGLKQTVNWKAFGVLLALHIIQQLSGINAILYHAHPIFQKTKTGISEHISVIIIGVTQVLVTFVAAAAVDRAGRVMLFLISLAIMFVTIAMVGVFFTVSRIDQNAAKAMGSLPTIALVLYICGFSIGTGPLPWAMLGEYLPDSVKTFMSTFVATVNWLLAFAITWMMPVLMENIHPEFVFYAFAAVCVLGFFFVILFVVETNRKTLAEIQSEIAVHKIGFSKAGTN